MTTDAPRLDLEQTREHVEGRLRDGAGAVPGPEEIAAIHRASRGVPAYIDFLLAQRQRDPAHRHAAGRSGQIVAAGAIIGLLAIAVYALYEKDAPPVGRGSTSMEAGGATAEPDALVQSAEPRSRPRPARIDGVRGDDWLQQQPRDAYLLQLIGATEFETIERFIAASNVPLRELTLVRGVREGGPWYLLLYGLYPDEDAARAQAALLPAAVRAQKPWPRRVAGVTEMLP